MNRRSFLRSLGAAVALSMVPFVRERPPERPPERPLITNWYQASRVARCTTPEYEAALARIVCLDETHLLFRTSP